MKKLLFVFALGLAISFNTQAQEEPTASKFENVSYHSMVKIDFKAGSYSKVQEILKSYMEAGEKAGIKGPQIFWLMSGEYDVIFVWTMEGGLADMEWMWSPDDIKWRKAMIESLGSEDKFMEMRNEWTSLIVKSDVEIARKQLE